MGIFNFFGNILGYLLWGLYLVFQNYGVAIIFFTIILKVVMFPMTLKQQRSMAGQAKLSEKQKELQAKYANNKTLYNEELQKLYEKEGVNPASGCLTTLIPFPIMLGIYYSVIYPLQNTLHISAEKITAATEFVKNSTDIVTTQYVELDIIKNWNILADQLTMFNADDVAKIESFLGGFKFLGLNLLDAPNQVGFMEFLWIIPVLSLLSSWFMQFYMNKTTAVKQQGCMKYMMYALPLLSAYWAFIFPGAVGFYWVTSALVGGVQSVITHKYFSATHMNTMNEAKNFVTLLEKESKIKPLPENLQKQIAAKIESQSNIEQKNPSKNASAKNSKKPKNAKSSTKNTGDYLGNKK